MLSITERLVSMLFKKKPYLPVGKRRSLGRRSSHVRGNVPDKTLDPAALYLWNKRIRSGLLLRERLDNRRSFAIAPCIHPWYINSVPTRTNFRCVRAKDGIGRGILVPSLVFKEKVEIIHFALANFGISHSSPLPEGSISRQHGLIRPKRPLRF